MIKHTVFARHCKVDKQDRLPIPLIKKSIKAALDFEGVDYPCEVSVLITCDEIIREINREYRGKDEPTDVLSFPMQEFPQPGWTEQIGDEKDPETGLIPLGEIVLSAQRVEKQAREHMQTKDQEAAYLTVHSVLHLLGYDHLDGADGKRQMRDHEKRIMTEIGF